MVPVGRHHLSLDLDEYMLLKENCILRCKQIVQDLFLHSLWYSKECSSRACFHGTIAMALSKRLLDQRPKHWESSPRWTGHSKQAHLEYETGRPIWSNSSYDQWTKLQKIWPCLLLSRMRYIPLEGCDERTPSLVFQDSTWLVTYMVRKIQFVLTSVECVKFKPWTPRWYNLLADNYFVTLTLIM